MDEENNNGDDRSNHGHDTNPETAHTKPAICDSHFYFLTLPRRLVIQCVAAFWLTAFYWFHFLVRETQPSSEFLMPMASSSEASEQ
jgi:hypothetical protein